jgi:hypothetical protein
MTTYLLAHPALKGALLAGLTGLGAAARVDFKAFKKMQSFTEFKAYNWNVALWNWGEGLIGGIVLGSGYGSYFS